MLSFNFFDAYFKMATNHTNNEDTVDNVDNVEYDDYGYNFGGASIINNNNNVKIYTQQPLQQQQYQPLHSYRQPNKQLNFLKSNKYEIASELEQRMMAQPELLKKFALLANSTPSFNTEPSFNAPAAYSTPSFNTEASFNAPAAYTVPSLNAPAAYTEASFNAPAAYTEASFNAPAAYSTPSFNAPAAYTEASFNAPAAYTEASFNAPAAPGVYSTPGGQYYSPATTNTSRFAPVGAQYGPSAQYASVPPSVSI